MRHVVPVPTSLPPLWDARGPDVPQPGATRSPPSGGGQVVGDRLSWEDSPASIRPDISTCMEVWSVVAEDACTVTVKGEVDCLTAPGFKEALLEVLSRTGPSCDVVVDLRRVTFLGAAGLTVLALAHHTAEITGRVLRVRCGTARAVIRPLQITGLWNAFHITDRLRVDGGC